MRPLRPVIGIVGSAGAYGRWLQQFFEQAMGLQVIGHDPADTGSASPEQVIAGAQVVIFSVPIRHTAQIIGQKHVDPTVASLLMCLESVFAVLAGWVFLG